MLCPFGMVRLVRLVRYAVPSVRTVPYQVHQPYQAYRTKPVALLHVQYLFLSVWKQHSDDYKRPTHLGVKIVALLDGSGARGYHSARSD